MTTKPLAKTTIRIFQKMKTTRSLFILYASFYYALWVPPYAFPFSLIISSQLFAFNYITRQWRLRSEPAHTYPGRWWSLESQTYFGPLFTRQIWAPSIFSSSDSATPIFGHLPFAGCYSLDSSLRTVNISVGRRACDSIPDISLIFDFIFEFKFILHFTTFPNRTL